jgi:hypothetical protein
MSLLDQFFVYHPEPWKEGDWSAAGGVPLEDVWFQAADGTKTVRLVCGAVCGFSVPAVVSRI